MTELPGQNQYLSNEQCLAILNLIKTSRNLDDISSGQSPRALSFIRPWGLLQFGSPSKEKSPKFTSCAACWLLEKVSAVISFTVHVRIHFIFHGEMVNHLTCQVQWKIDVIGFFWQHHAGILRPYQSTDVAFSPKGAWVVNRQAAYLILF